MSEQNKIVIPVNFLYIKEQDVVSIQVSSLVFMQIPFKLFQDGYKAMKEKRERKILTLDS